MSPEAIQSLIELFGVEKGVQILNLFTAPGDAERTHRPRRQSIGKRPKELIREIDLPPKVTTG